MKKMTKRSIMNNVILLYCVFIVMCVNIGYLLSRNDYQSILIFSISCFIIYLINHNMIVVIGASIIIINVLGLLRNVEGFKDKDEDEDEIEKVDQPETVDIENFDEDDNLTKLKELNPKVLKAIKHLSSININDINEYMDTMKNVIDS